MNIPRCPLILDDVADDDDAGPVGTCLAAGRRLAKGKSSSESLSVKSTYIGHEYKIKNYKTYTIILNAKITVSLLVVDVGWSLGIAGAAAAFTGLISSVVMSSTSIEH